MYGMYKPQPFRHAAGAVKGSPMREETFEDWGEAALRDYVDGGLRAEAAAAIGASAADGLAPLFQGRLTYPALTTWFCALDLEVLAYARRSGEAMFLEGAQCK